MNLSIEQVSAVRDGEPVLIADSGVGVDCVLIRADRFEQLVGGDAALTDQERRYLLQQFGLRAGWDDLELDVYEEYREPVPRSVPAGVADP